MGQTITVTVFPWRLPSRWHRSLFTSYRNLASSTVGQISEKPAAEVWREVHARLTMDGEAELTVDDSISGNDLRRLAFDKLALPHERPAKGEPFFMSGEHVDPRDRLFISTSLHGFVTERSVDSGRSLRELGIADGTLLVLRIQDLFIDHQLASSRDPQEAMDRLLTSNELVPQDVPALWGVLLYDDGDKELAAYVRRYFAELDAMSGETFRILVMEDDSRPQREVVHYWRAFLPRPEYRVWRGMRWLRTKPYERSRVYRIARRYGIRSDHLPCLMLVGGRNRDESLAFPLPKSEHHEYFRKLFAELTETVGADAERGDDVWAQLSTAYQKILDNLVPSEPDGPRYVFHGHTVFINRMEGKNVSENFVFHGQTNFINKPAHIVVSDFLNNYGGTDSATTNKLAGLVQLALKSHDLPDRDKEDVVGELHTIADRIKTGKGAEPETATRLQKVKTALTSAADIATPAAQLISTILAALGLGG